MKERDNVISYKKVDSNANWRIVDISDKSFIRDKPSVSGTVLLLSSIRNDNVAPLLWKSNPMINICTSTKDAKT